MQSPSRKTSGSRNTVRLIALLAAIVVTVSVITIAVLSGGPKANGTGITAGEFGDAPTIGESTGQGMVIELADEDDAEKQIGEIRFSSFDPITPTTKLVENPVAWLYLDDGRMALIEAERGRFETPLGQKRPESGRLEGSPRIRLFDPAAGNTRPDPASAPPLLTATMDQPLDFDLRSARVSTQGRLEVTSERLDFVGHDVRAILNEQRERIDLLEVQRGERLTFRPEPGAAPSGPSGSETGEPIAGTGAGVRAGTRSAPRLAPAGLVTRGTLPVAHQPAAEVPIETRYAAEFEDGVRVVRGGLEMTSDLLNIWVRLIDNKLPAREDARAQTGGARAFPNPAFSGSVLAAATAQSLASVFAAQPDGPGRGNEIAAEPPLDQKPATQAGTEPGQPVTLTWTGPLTLRALPSGEIPEPLGRDDLAVRATGQRTGPVRFADTGEGVRGEATALEYYDTTERIVLESASAGVRIESPRSGTLAGVRRLDVSLPTGSVSIAGEGELRAREHDTPADDGTRRRRLIRWSEGAEFLFQVLGGEMTDQIRLANFSGRVLGFSDAAEVEGDGLSAEFSPDDDGAAALRRVRIYAANTTDGRGGTIRGDDLEVWFREDGADGDLEPRRLIVRGNAEGAQPDGSVFDADLINASLVRDAQGRVAAHRVVAEGVRRIADGRGMSAVADKLDANVSRQTALLEGNATVSRDGTVMTGEWLDFDGERNRAVARGPGTIRHNRDGSRFEASWQKAMAFDDSTGGVSVIGRAQGRLVSPDGAEDAFRGERVVLQLVPAGELNAASENTGDDRLRTAVLTGIPEAGRDGRARLERRRYGTRNGERTADEIYFLEGDRVRVENDAGTLTVPTPGLMLLADRRPERDAPARGDVLSGSAGDRGVTMIEWAGTMNMDRGPGTITAERGVRVTHKRLSDGLVATIESERLVARVSELETGTGGDGDATGQLRDVQASGAVYAVIGQREVVADELRYDAERGIITATAAPGNLITVFENDKGTAVNAAGLRWDVAGDRVTLDRPSPISVPR